MRDPKIIEPAGFDPAAGWAECRAEVDKCGGIADADGNVNWRAAFSADPGCCSCPHCGAYRDNDRSGMREAAEALRLLNHWSDEATHLNHKTLNACRENAAIVLRKLE